MGHKKTKSLSSAMMSAELKSTPQPQVRTAISQRDLRTNSKYTPSDSDNTSMTSNNGAANSNAKKYVLKSEPNDSNDRSILSSASHDAYQLRSMEEVKGNKESNSNNNNNMNMNMKSDNIFSTPVKSSVRPVGNKKDATERTYYGTGVSFGDVDWEDGDTEALYVAPRALACSDSDEEPHAYNSSGVISATNVTLSPSVFRNDLHLELSGDRGGLLVVSILI